MARVVMCWELGADLGHVARLKPLAEALAARGHEVSFIVRENLPAERLLDPARFRWYQAPFQTEAVPAPMAPTLSFAHVMHNVGFNRPQAILGRIHAWRNLFTSLKPDLLVFDHSPSALLAARGLKTRRVVLGTGFGIPPDTSPWPPFDAADAGADVRGAEESIRANINEALKTLGEAPIGRLADIYRAQASLLFTLKELDHYPDRPDGDYWGPTHQETGVAPAWPVKNGRRVFAYLKPFKTLSSLLDTLKQSGRPSLIYLGKGAEDLRRGYSGADMNFSDRPVDLTRAVADADLVVCHAGHGTVSAALFAGKPLLLLPLNIEQRMLSARVAAAGAGLAAPALAAEGMRQKFLRLLEEPGFTEVARTFKERYAALKVEDIPERFARLVEKLLASEAL
ncbi:MAG: glycosyltransferase [Bacillota bacterium]